MDKRKTFKKKVLDSCWVVLTHILPDKPYLSMKYRAIFKRRMNWNNPETFNEKLQWLKLYGKGKEYAKFVDKVQVKKYVSETIGDEYVIPTLGVWNSEKEIDFSSLPNQFVLKCNHDSGNVVVCTDKSTLEVTAARDAMKRSLNNNYFLMGRETPYKYVERKVFAEKYMHDQKTDDIRDYKFLCFDGIPKIMYVGSDRASDVKFDFFNMDFEHLEIREQGYSNSPKPIEKPANFELMKSIASKLSKGFPHIRVDLYEIQGKVYFGELTFYSFSGLVPYEPSSWDYTIGSWLTLPTK